MRLKPEEERRLRDKGLEDAERDAAVKWEHGIVPLPYDIKDQANDLQRLGKEGWELVCVVVVPGTGVTAYLKRPLGDSG